jgi:hypothetical protein
MLGGALRSARKIAVQSSKVLIRSTHTRLFGRAPLTRARKKIARHPVIDGARRYALRGGDVGFGVFSHT